LISAGAALRRTAAAVAEIKIHPNPAAAREDADKQPGLAFALVWRMMRPRYCRRDDILNLIGVAKSAACLATVRYRPERTGDAAAT